MLRDGRSLDLGNGDEGELSRKAQNILTAEHVRDQGLRWTCQRERAWWFGRGLIRQRPCDHVQDSTCRGRGVGDELR